MDVYLHSTFLLLFVLVAIAEGGTAPSLFVALLGILFFLGLFACVLAHEFGHILMARRFGVGTRDVTLLPIGGMARLERIPDTPRQEFWVAIAGPAVNRRGSLTPRCRCMTSTPQVGSIARIKTAAPSPAFCVTGLRQCLA